MVHILHLFFLPQSLSSLLGTFHLSVWCSYFFYVTILIVTIKVKLLNYMGLFLCFGQVQLCSPGVSPYVKVLSLLLQVEKQKFRREFIFFITSIETMDSQNQILNRAIHVPTHSFISSLNIHSFILPLHDSHKEKSAPVYLYI